MKHVRIIDEGTTRSASSEALASYLQTHFGRDIDVAVVEARGAGLPTEVVDQLHATSRFAPPAMVVDGNLVAVGDLPSWGEAVDLVAAGGPRLVFGGRGCCSDPACSG